MIWAFPPAAAHAGDPLMLIPEPLWVRTTADGKGRQEPPTAIREPPMIPLASEPAPCPQPGHNPPENAHPHTQQMRADQKMEHLLCCSKALFINQTLPLQHWSRSSARHMKPRPVWPGSSCPHLCNESPAPLQGWNHHCVFPRAEGFRRSVFPSGTSSSLGSLSKSGEAVTSVESPASSTASTSAPTTHGWTPVSESSSPSDTTPSCESSASAVRPKLYAGGRANGSLSKSPFSGSVTRPPASSQQLQEPGHSHPHATSKATVSSGGSCWKEGGHQQGEGGLERGQHQNDPSGDKQRNRRDRISSPFADPGFHWAHQDATSSFFSSSVSEGEGHHV